MYGNGGNVLADPFLKIGENYLLMTGEDASFNKNGYTAHHIMTESFYNAIRLLENGQIDLYFVNELPEGYFGFDGVNPPKNFDELRAQLAEPLYEPPVVESPYSFSCEDPDEMIKN